MPDSISNIQSSSLQSSGAQHAVTQRGGVHRGAVRRSEQPEMTLDTAVMAQWQARFAREDSIVRAYRADSAANARAYADSIASVETVPAWHSGLLGRVRPTNGAADSGLLTVLTVLFVVLALNFKYCPRIFANFFGDLWHIRRRANVFDEHTARESRVLILLVLQYVACGGLLLYSAVKLFDHAPEGHVFTSCALLMGLMLVYYAVQTAAYTTVGWLFTDPDRSRQWLRGFNASQTLAGILLTIPALITLFYPGAARPTLIAAAVIYVIARLVFVTKGFRIFFNKISGLSYFILYLCTLEVIPALLVYKTAIFLVNMA